MTKIPSVEERVGEISWNLRKDIKSICGTYDTVITNKLEKFLTQALTADRLALLTELGGNEAVANKNIDETIEDFYRIFDTENVWQGEDDWTKNVPIGNLEDWLRKTLTDQRTALLTELRDSGLLEELDAGEAPGDNAVGSEQRTFGSNRTKQAIKAHINNLINPGV